MQNFCLNRYRSIGTGAYHAFDSSNIDPREFHRTVRSYSVSPLRSLPALAKELGVGNLLVKDESHRFGLKAFKGLGASYAIYRLFKALWLNKHGEELTPEQFWSEIPGSIFGPSHFCTATDGNHGRGVAWIARLLKREATVYMPRDSVSARVRNVESEGAEVVVVDGDYDLAVRTAAEQSEKNNWQVISDTSYDGYTDIPFWISCGYLTLFEEVSEQLRWLNIDHIDCCLVPGGVGALAAAAAIYYRYILKDDTIKLVSIEPDSAACLLESALDPNGAICVSHGEQNSIMAGLNCATPSQIAWPIIRAGFDLFISIRDSYAERAMRMCYNPIGHDPRVVSGESGAASLAGLLALLSDSSLSEALAALHLTKDSKVLVLSTEGDTDPTGFQRIIRQDQTHR